MLYVVVVLAFSSSTTRQLICVLTADLKHDAGARLDHEWTLPSPDDEFLDADLCSVNVCSMMSRCNQTVG